jgi:hypothetical protein
MIMATTVTQKSPGGGVKGRSCADMASSAVTSTEVVYDSDFPGRKRRPPQILRIA